jgi:hypothetical protein
MAPGQIIEVNDIPFIDRLQTAGRFLPTLLFFDEDWRFWAEIEAGTDEKKRFIEIAAAWPSEHVYFGRRPERGTDFRSIFLDTVAQRANLLPFYRFFSGILDDIHNLAAAFAKLDLIFESGRTQSNHSNGTHRMAATEVEYILLVCRSVFDLLQEFMASYWVKVVPFDPNAKKKALKKHFSDMALHGQTAKTAQELKDQFNMPDALAACYVRYAQVFLKIREARDKMVHGGSQVQVIFRGKNEFVIRKHLGPFQNLNIWREDEVEESDLVPLAPVLGMIVCSTLGACDDFAQVLANIITLPDPTVPGMSLFVRGYHDDIFARTLIDANTRFAEGRRLVPDQA